MDAAWEYAVLCFYTRGHDPETERREQSWVIQTVGGIEHGEVATDELDLLNELGHRGWRVRFRAVNHGMFEARLLEQHVRSLTGMSLPASDVWLLERTVDTQHD